MTHPLSMKFKQNLITWREIVTAVTTNRTLLREVRLSWRWPQTHFPFNTFPPCAPSHFLIFSHSVSDVSNFCASFHFFSTHVPVATLRSSKLISSTTSPRTNHRRTLSNYRPAFFLDYLLHEDGSDRLSGNSYQHTLRKMSDAWGPQHCLLNYKTIIS